MRKVHKFPSSSARHILPFLYYATAELHRSSLCIHSLSWRGQGNQKGNESLTQAERSLSTVLLFVPARILLCSSFSAMQEFHERNIRNKSKSEANVDVCVASNHSVCLCVMQQEWGDLPLSHHKAQYVLFIFGFFTVFS